MKILWSAISTVKNTKENKMEDMADSGDNCVTVIGEGFPWQGKLELSSPGGKYETCVKGQNSEKSKGDSNYIQMS